MSDLDGKDIAPFRCSTRSLAGRPTNKVAFHVRTNDLCVLRGKRGAYITRACGKRAIRRAAERESWGTSSTHSTGILYAQGNRREDKYAAWIVHRGLRNSDVVDAAASVKWLMECGEQARSVSELEYKAEF